MHGKETQTWQINQKNKPVQNQHDKQPNKLKAHKMSICMEDGWSKARMVTEA